MTARVHRDARARAWLAMPSGRAGADWRDQDRARSPSATLGLPTAVCLGNWAHRRSLGRSQVVRQRVLVPRSQVRILAPQPSTLRGVTATSLAAVVMAGGLGTRMRSATPKHLHPLLGRRMVDWVLASRAAARRRPARRRRLARDGTRARFVDGVEVAVQEQAARDRRRAPLGARGARGPRRRPARPLRRHAAAHGRAARASSSTRTGPRDAAATVLAFEPADAARLRPRRPRRRRLGPGDRRGRSTRRRSSSRSAR